MTENEIKLINLVRDHDNPSKALLKALEIIILYLNRPEPFESVVSVVSRKFVETIQA